MLPQTARIGLRLTTGRLFLIAFVVGAAPVLFLFGSGFASTMVMSVPAAVLIWPVLLPVYYLFGDGWPAVSFMAGVNGLVYGAVVVGIWEVYQALKRKRDRRP